MNKINRIKNHSIIKNLSKSMLVGSLAIASCLVGSNAIAAEVQNSNQGFIVKKTTEIEFSLAIVTVVVGLIVSEKLQRNQEQKQG